MTIDVGGGLTMGCLVTCGGDKYLTVGCMAPRTNVLNLMIFDGEDKHLTVGCLALTCRCQRLNIPGWNRVRPLSRQP